MTVEEQIIDEIAQFTSDPLGFARFAYPWGELGPLEDFSSPRKWQSEVLSEIGRHLTSPLRFTPLQIAVASGHGVGKSALIAMIADWAMSTCDDCRVMVTANTEDQLITKTWPEVTKWFNLSINRSWWDLSATRVTAKQKGHEAVWRFDRVTWSENNTEAFQGLHNKGKRIVVIYDEASAIADRIWEVTEGALTDEATEIIWIVFGNPTKNTGRFKECFGRYKHRWSCRQIDSRTVEGTNKEQIEKWIADYGEDSDFVRVRVRGEFPRAGSAQFIPSDIVAAARRRKIEVNPRDWPILAVDVARFGDDQTIIGLRQGPKLTILDRLRGQDTMQTAMRVKMRMEEHRPRATIVDGDGVGAGVIDWLDLNMAEWLAKNKPCIIQEFHGGESPKDPFMYFNRRAEVWGASRTWLATGSIPDEPEIESDLCGPEYGFSAKNQIQLERKEDMKKRGLASPDIGDMLAMTFAATPQPRTEEELLSERLTRINDPLWRTLTHVKATLDKAKAGEVDERPEWMR